MKYDIPVSIEISRDIYSMHTFDVEYEGEERALQRLILYLSTQAHFKALQVCTDISKGSEERKSFDRGYVHGINEVISMLRKGRAFGRKIQFPEEGREVPPTTV
jgi:hypothetical protein